MSYTVGQVSRFAGITVRTLHHYDKAGLLSPGARSPAGYRLYTEADLARLQRILFYRELGFPLDEITTLLRAPDADLLDRLRARHRRLTEEMARLGRLVEVAERAMEVQQTGVRLTPDERFEVFGEVAFDLSYATDAAHKWHNSPGHRRAMARADTHTKEDWARLMAEATAWRTRLLAAHDAEEPPDGPTAMDLAEEHRAHLSRWFTPCPTDMHTRIADDFLTDPRAFALLIPPPEQRPGLATYLHTAIHANAVRNPGAPATTEPAPSSPSPATASPRTTPKPTETGRPSPPGTMPAV
ncbi:MerR family transcriptional regulator [Streptomyces catenulae]|uniref:MerR family transcriptional regulator n=1 Tax=Streptomyces catenulae TaxID=66875 RepID=A0ABV2Z501_9ACTN|nr:MerR family transcriptional regulator [Streptomyces catenulae]